MTVEAKTRELKILRESEKDWQYVHDAVWGNWKGRTLKKIDASKKMGKGGGPECRITEMNKVILDILGKETPVVSRIGVPDSMEDAASIQTGTNENALSNCPRKRKLRGNHSSNDDEEEELMKMKLKLQVDLLQVETRIQALELFKLETEFNVGPSEFTDEFHESCYTSTHNK